MRAVKASIIAEIIKVPIWVAKNNSKNAWSPPQGAQSCLPGRSRTFVTWVREGVVGEFIDSISLFFVVAKINAAFSMCDINFDDGFSGRQGQIFLKILNIRSSRSSAGIPNRVSERSTRSGSTYQQKPNNR